jgi:hypothetical protein
LDSTKRSFVGKALRICGTINTEVFGNFSSIVFQQHRAFESILIAAT